MPAGSHRADGRTREVIWGCRPLILDGEALPWMDVRQGFVMGLGSSHGGEGGHAHQDLARLAHLAPPRHPRAIAAPSSAPLPTKEAEGRPGLHPRQARASGTAPCRSGRSDIAASTEDPDEARASCARAKSRRPCGSLGTRRPTFTPATTTWRCLRGRGMVPRPTRDGPRWADLIPRSSPRRHGSGRRSHRDPSPLSADAHHILAGTPRSTLGCPSRTA